MKNDILKEIEREENFMKLESNKTRVSKLAFIDEIKSGLGDEIQESLKPIKKKDSLLKRVYKKIKSWITIN